MLTTWLMEYTRLFGTLRMHSILWLHFVLLPTSCLKQAFLWTSVEWQDSINLDWYVSVIWNSFLNSSGGWVLPASWALANGIRKSIDTARNHSPILNWMVPHSHNTSSSLERITWSVDISRVEYCMAGVTYNYRHSCELSLPNVLGEQKILTCHWVLECHGNPWKR